MSMQRRELLRLAVAVPAAAWLASAAATAPAGRRLFVYEPRLAAARWRALAVRSGMSGEALALPADADRVRFARACLGQAPAWFGGVLCPADFLVLAGSAEEEGFRVREEELLRPPGQASYVLFGMQHRAPPHRMTRR